MQWIVFVFTSLITSHVMTILYCEGGINSQPLYATFPSFAEKAFYPGHATKACGSGVSSLTTAQLARKLAQRAVSWHIWSLLLTSSSNFLLQANDLQQRFQNPYSTQSYGTFRCLLSWSCALSVPKYYFHLDSNTSRCFIVIIIASCSGLESGLMGVS